MFVSDVVWVDAQDVVGANAEEIDGFWFNLLDHLPIQNQSNGDVRLSRDGLSFWRIIGVSAQTIREKMDSIHRYKPEKGLDRVPL